MSEDRLEVTSVEMVFRSPSAVQRVVAWPLYCFFRGLTRVIPVRWLIDDLASRRRTARFKIAVWAYGGAFFYAERRDGRL